VERHGALSVCRKEAPQCLAEGNSHHALLLASRTLRKPKRSQQQEEDLLIDHPSNEAVPLLNKINDKLQSSRTWSPPANTGRDWTSHPFVAWVAEKNRSEGEGWLRKGLFQKGSGQMKLAEKTSVIRIHASPFRLQDCQYL
jgi:hypothetical protein